SIDANLHADDLRRIFNQLDRNNDRFLTIDELSWLLDKIGSSSLQFTVAKLESSVGKPSLDFDEIMEF
ncbi:Probable calcium-binding protein CML44, partial [Linum perenne]